jgi:hypothetical protein
MAVEQDSATCAGSDTQAGMKVACTLAMIGTWAGYEATAVGAPPALRRVEVRE